MPTLDLYILHNKSLRSASLGGTIGEDGSQFGSDLQWALSHARLTGETVYFYWANGWPACVVRKGGITWRDEPDAQRPPRAPRRRVETQLRKLVERRGLGQDSFLVEFQSPFGERRVSLCDSWRDALTLALRVAHNHVCTCFLSAARKHPTFAPDALSDGPSPRGIQLTRESRSRGHRRGTRPLITSQWWLVPVAKLSSSYGAHPVLAPWDGGLWWNDPTKDAW